MDGWFKFGDGEGINGRFKFGDGCCTDRRFTFGGGGATYGRFAFGGGGGTDCRIGVTGDMDGTFKFCVGEGTDEIFMFGGKGCIIGEPWLSLWRLGVDEDGCKLGEFVLFIMGVAGLWMLGELGYLWLGVIGRSNWRFLFGRSMIDDGRSETLYDERSIGRL